MLVSKLGLVLLITGYEFFFQVNQGLMSVNKRSVQLVAATTIEVRHFYYIQLICQVLRLPQKYCKFVIFVLILGGGT